MAAYRWTDIPVYGFSGQINGYVQIEIGTQTKAPLQALTTIFSTVTDLTVCPFISLPKYKKARGSDMSLIGLQAMEFVFSNIVVDGSGNTLYDLLEAEDPNETTWHFRLFFKQGASAYGNPKFWGIVERADPKGSWVTLYDSSTWSFRFTVVDMATLLEEVTTFDIINTYLLHATYDVPTGTTNAVVHLTNFDVSGDGIQSNAINKIFLPESPQGREWWEAGYIRFIRLRDIVRAIGESIGLNTDVNGGGSVDCSTRWASYQAGSPGYADTLDPWDNLHVISAMYVDWAEYYQQYGFFDQGDKEVDREMSNASVFNTDTAIELLKRILIPFGLTARIQIDASGTGYFYVSEYHHDAGHDFSDSYLVDAEIAPTDRAVAGMSVRALNGPEVALGKTNDRNVDIMFLGQARIVKTDRDWYKSYYSTGNWDVRDLQPLFQGVYARTGSTANFYAIYKVVIKDAGRGIYTVTSNAGGTTAPSSYEVKKYGYAGLFAWACLRYMYSRDSAATTRVGVNRRYAYEAKLVIPDIDFDPWVGDYLENLPNVVGDYDIEAIEYDFEECVTKFETARLFTA